MIKRQDSSDLRRRDVSGIIKANYHLIIGGIIKRKAPVGSEAWEGRAGAEGL